jgi:hypothetical protein
MPQGRVSRQDFLKLLGAAGFGLALGGLGFMSLKTGKTGKPAVLQKASAQAAGSWALGQSTTTIPIHATYLHNGFILYIAGSGFHSGHRDGPYEGRLLDPLTGFETDVPMFDDLFCNGSTILANGNVLIAGGTGAYDDNVNNNCNGRWHGINVAYEFDVAAGELVPVQNMAAGRWYPTLITLADGKVINFEGFDEFGIENRLVELYDPSAKTWSIKYVTNRSDSYCIGETQGGVCEGAGQICFGGTAGHGMIPKIGSYPRMHLLANGIIAYAGMHQVVRLYNPATGAFTNNVAMMSTYRHYGTSVLLPLQNIATEKGKVLAAGGSPMPVSSPASNSVDIIDFNASATNTPVIRVVEPLQYARKYLVPVILPDGKVIVFGGSSQGTRNYTIVPEMFDPVTETWTSLPPSIVPRSYHASALLLSDGRVWLGGSTATKGDWELRTEFFSPGYMTENRPTISGAPTVQGYGGTISISTPDADDIQSVSLVRLMSTTHHYEANQRFIWLQIVNKTANTITVSSPVNGNIAPPGYYMIHILNSAGVPSEAKIIRIDGTMAPDTNAPEQVTGLTVTSTSSTQLDLLWTPNTEMDIDHYDVYRDTVTGFTPSSGNRIAQPATSSYSDTGLETSTSYFYRVAAVDSSGNISPFSLEVSGTPTPAGETFYNVSFPGNSAAALYGGGLSVRFGEEARVAASVIVGKSIKFWKVYLRRIGAAEGDVTAVIRRSSDDSVVAAFNETIAAASLLPTWSEITFSLTTPQVIQGGDRILIQYSGTRQVEINLYNSDQFDGTNTRRVRYGTGYVGGSAEDVVGSMISGPPQADNDAPGQVTGVSITPVSETQLDIEWAPNPESDLDHYDIHRDTVSGFAPNATNLIAQPTSESYSDTGLVSSTTYYYRIAAVDTSNNIGPMSSEASGTPEPPGEIFYDVPGPSTNNAALFAGSSIRYGVQANTSASLLVGKSLRKWKVYLRRVQAPSGTIQATIRRASDDSIVAAFNETLDAASLPTAYAAYEFNLAAPYVIQPGDRILIEYSGPSRVEVSRSNVDMFDGSLTRRIHYTGSSYVTGSTHDVAGTMSA